MSVTPDDPQKLPPQFRPEGLGGLGRLPVFSIRVLDFSVDLSIREDPKRPTYHAFVEPTERVLFASYQSALCASAPLWRKQL